MTANIQSFGETIARNLKEIIANNPDYGMEFSYTDWETDFFRFYRSQTNYNISKKDISLTGTIEKDKKKSTFHLSAPSTNDIISAVDQAKTTLEKLPPDPDFTDFENNTDIFNYKKYSDSINDIPLSRKIEIIDTFAKIADKHNFKVFGTFICLTEKTRLINSTGLDKLFYQSPVMLDVTAVSDSNMTTVIDSFGGDDFSYFDLKDFSSRFENKINKATLDVVDVEPGDYTAILAPHALQELLEYLIYGVYGHSLDDGSSFFEGKLGTLIFPENISISSAPSHPRLITYPYNADGHYANDLPIIDKGTLKNYVMNHYYSNKLKIQKNGSVGTKALTMDKGNKSLDEMISGVKRGLYISNLHYMNFINEKETSVTGLTRDGTFLIEDGKIVNVVNNLRYTEKISEILENIIEIENHRYAIPKSENYDSFSLYSGLMPHVKTSRFKISSSTRTI